MIEMTISIIRKVSTKGYFRGKQLLGLVER